MKNKSEGKSAKKFDYHNLVQSILAEEKLNFDKNTNTDLTCK